MCVASTLASDYRCKLKKGANKNKMKKVYIRETRGGGRGGARRRTQEKEEKKKKKKQEKKRGGETMR